MTKEKYLIDYLLQERKQQVDINDYSFDLYRALVNLRMPENIDKSI